MLSLLGSILFSCDFNPYYSSCGNGYYFSSDKEYGVSDLSYEYAKNPNKDSTLLFHDSLGIISKININTYYKGTNVVEQHIEWFEYNDSIIVIKQKPKAKFLEMDTLYYLDEYNRFKAFDYHEYWIIKTNTNDVYGPLSLNHYHDYCIKLGVPEKFRVLFDDAEPSFLARLENTATGKTIIDFVIIVLGTILRIILFSTLAAILCSPIVILILVIRKVRRRNRENNGLGI